MQRSISDQKSLKPFVYAIAFVAYIGLSSIYLFLPPLLAVLYIFFAQAIDRDDSVFIALVSFCLIVFEAEKSYFLFSTIIYFTIIHKLVIPKLKQIISCSSCVNFLLILIVYLGFYIFCLLFANVFLTPMPSMSYYVFYYIFIEFFIVSIL